MSNAEQCSHQNSVKWGAYRNKTGWYQKWKCRDCGTTWIGEKIKSSNGSLGQASVNNLQREAENE